MEELIEKLNKQFGDKYAKFKLFDVVYDKLNSICTVCFLFPMTISEVSEEEREEILNFVKEFFALNGEIKVKFKKSFLDQPLIKKEVKNYFEEYHKGITPYINLDNITSQNDGLNVKVQIALNDDVLSMLDEGSLKQKLIQFLNRRFIAIFEVEFKENQDKLPEEIDAPDIISVPKNNVIRYDVNIIKKIFGGEIAPKPEYIKNISKPKTSCILAGKISDIVKKNFTIKKGKRAGEEKSYYSFNLKDGSSTIECIYFCPKANEKTMDAITENASAMTLLLVGDIEKGLSGRLTYYIKKMSTCSVVERVVEEYHEVNSETLKSRKPVVIPETIETSSQETLFGEKAKYNNLIMENEIVVFDLETTGLDPEYCEITEIGAVKIINGQIKERFGSFVKTQHPIPEEVTRLTHITNEMIADAPCLQDVILDFYAYTRGCIISGYNIIGFDMQFIRKAANKFGLKFDNQIVDAFIVAKQAGLRVTNYKLGTVAKALGVSLVDAHRAYNDAQATGQVLLELSKIKK